MYLAKENMRLMNRLMFPLLLQKQSRENPEEWFEEPLKPIIDELTHMAKGLQPFEEEIKEFYDRDMFMSVFITSDEVLFLEDWQQYVELWRSKSDEAIKQLFVEALLRESDGNRFTDEEIQEKSKELVGNPFALLDELNKMPLEDTVRWAYFNAITSPVKAVNEFIELHEKLEEVFEAVYEEYEQLLLESFTIFERRMDETPEFIQNAFQGITKITEHELSSNQIRVIPMLILSDFLGTNIEKYDIDVIFLGGRFVETVDLLVTFRENQQKERISIFKSLGDPTRYNIICQIASGVKSVKNIAESLGITSATVGYHINQMLISNLVMHDWNKKDCQNPINQEMLHQAIQGLFSDLQLDEKIDE